MKYQFLPILFLLSLKISIAQDSLVFYSDLSFNSTFEEKTFEDHFINNTNNSLALFMSISPSVSQEQYESARDIFEAKFNSLNTDKLNSKKPDKRVKAIYEDVHKDFFEQYRVQNRFNEIFETGRYNCVSSSALYAIFLEELDIPFTIKEKPTHVYLIAYPKSDRIIVESTDPSGGFIKYNGIYKQEFVNRMAKAKLISNAEVNSKSVDELFDEYYFYDTDITLKELVGIQYMNDALYRIDDKDFKGAHRQMEKARMFYKNDKVAMLLLALNAELIDNQKYEDIENIDLLVKLSRFTSYGIDDDIVLSEFRRVINTQLIDKGDADELTRYYTRLNEGIIDEQLKAELGYVYNYEQGRAHFNQGKYNESLTYFEEAFILKPTNLDINNIFINALRMTLQLSTNNEVISKLEQYKEKHPALLENNLFKSILVNSYLVQFGSAYDLGNESEGKKYKQLFEQYYNPYLTINESSLGRAYSITAVYYFKKGYTAKAKSIINEGLNISPNNHELLVRKNMIR